MRFGTGTLLRWGGLACWSSEFLVLQLDLTNRVQKLHQLSSGQSYLWHGAYVCFGVTYWWATRDAEHWLASGIPSLRPIRLLGCIVMSLSALIINGLFSSQGDMTVLLVLVAALLPGLLSWRWTLVWISIQSIALSFIMWKELSLGAAQYTALFMGIVQVVTALLIQILRQERERRRQLSELNISLQFTQAQLQQATRDAERHRIARELHDVMGHHLTVLGLELELATHLPVADVRESVVRARKMTQTALTEVRESVSTLREDTGDWIAVLQQLTSNIPEIKVHLKLPNASFLPCPHEALIILRFVQESVTNSIKHAHARNLWLSVHDKGHELHLEAFDDGRVHWPVHPGHGLLGMRERVVELHGDLTYQPGPEGGLHLQAWIPRTELG